MIHSKTYFQIINQVYCSPPSIGNFVGNDRLLWNAEQELTMGIGKIDTGGNLSWEFVVEIGDWWRYWE